jgi:hypothetical protein
VAVETSREGKDVSVNRDLIIPIYIDTNALLDLLASIEGGFSVVEKVTTQSADARGIDRGVKAETGTEFGIPNVLSLLKLNLGYSADWKRAQEESQKMETERYHTYGSLFYRLREYLYGNSLIKRLGENQNNWDAIQPSDFVEIHGLFRPNPLANSLEIVDRLAGMFQLLSTGSFVSQPLQKGSKGKPVSEEQKNLQEQKRAAQQQAKQIEEIKKFLRGVLSDLQAENIRAFVVDLDEPEEYKAIVLLYLSYLRDQTMIEISHREYRLLGKVVRKIEADSDEFVDLLLGTGLGGIGREVLEELVNALAQAPGMNLPEIETQIAGPALEIVPIAIFV